MKFLGCVDDVTEGILAGFWDHDDWVLEVNSSFVSHGNVSNDSGQDAQNQEESGNQEESMNKDMIPKYAQDAIFDYAAEQSRDQEEWAVGPHTTYRTDSAFADPDPPDPCQHGGSRGTGVTVEDDPFEITPAREVTCPACLGRHRARAKDARCRLGPPSGKSSTY